MRLAPISLLATLVAAGGCVASKGDIRLLQDELRATRAIAARAESSSALRDAELRAQVAAAADAAVAATARVNDSLRALSQRVASFQGSMSGQLDQIVRDLIQTQALMGQTTRNLQEMRAQYEALRDRPPAAAIPADSGQRPPPGMPGPATLYQNAYRQFQAGSFRISRQGFEQILANYPSADEAAGAQLYIGEAFEGERNQAAADSVYQLVVSRYPKSPEAPTALYKRGMMLWNANKKADARPLFQRILRDYPSSDVVDLAKGMLDRR
jgi:tol-pal system protein YbgF